MRRERLSTLANALVEGTWKMRPTDVTRKYDGNVAQDATLVPLLGKVGNPAARNLSENCRTINHDAGFYGRAGAHGALTASDAKHLNSKDPQGKYKGTSSIKRTWGVEAEIARMLPNIGGGSDEFPGLTIGVGFHIPGAVAGEGHRMLKSLHDRGHTLNYVAVDRAYPGGKVFEFQIEAQRLGAKLVFDYKDRELGVQQSDTRGFVQVSGAWYSNTLPNVLRGTADTEFRDARVVFDSAQVPLNKRSTSPRPRRTKSSRLQREISREQIRPSPTDSNGERSTCLSARARWTTAAPVDIRFLSPLRDMTRGS